MVASEAGVLLVKTPLAGRGCSPPSAPRLPLRQIGYVTRTNGAQAGALRLPDGSVATTQKRNARLRSRFGTCHVTCA